jgi:hypothetical protein
MNALATVPTIDRAENAVYCPLGKVLTGSEKSPPSSSVGLQARSDTAINTVGILDWVLRDDSPTLLASTNGFLRMHRQGTAFGQQLIATCAGSP